MTPVPNITVIGAGFGAVTAIKTLRKSNPAAHITLHQVW